MYEIKKNTLNFPSDLDINSTVHFKLEYANITIYSDSTKKKMHLDVLLRIYMNYSPRILQ